ncbi:MAG: unsaturated rhamnogalacturonyl hydrolase, partial [Acidobacteriaceae bacterium]|nr:unsaturated rhamnogalacturonyl hydrolase [Acidobacteriaceae bacterium]
SALALIAALAVSQPASAQKEFSKWPAGTSPKEIGQRVAKRLISSPHSLSTGEAKQPYINYPESVTWYGALTFAQLSGDKELGSRLIQRFDPLFDTDSKFIPEPKHVDLTVFGAVPVEIYVETRQQKYLDLGRELADKQWADPAPDGLTGQTRYWIDDMYMITLVQVQAYRATGDPKYLDRAALEMSAYLEKLQQPNGLFYHAPDTPFFWGRGNGWVAAGMAELLRSLPQTHPRRARILEAYRRMMATLLRYQAKDGMWRQLLDHPEAWPETSSTGMFTFAMITGVKNGWLDKKTYAPAARKGWLALITYLEPNGDIRNVCEGTGKKNDLNYYLTRARNTGDLHGQAPILWSASALLR